MTTADRGERDDLGSFVAATRRSNGLSYRQLAGRAVDPQTGQRVRYQWLNKLEAGELSRAPDAWQLRALATGLGVPSDVVKGLAARQWLDFEVVQMSLGGPGDWALYLQMAGLPDEDRQTLRVLVAELIRRQEQGGDSTAARTAPA